MGVDNYLTKKQSYHILWLFKHPLGREKDYETISDVTWGDICAKQFNRPYLLTMGASNGGWVRYQILPAYVHGHRVNLVYYTTPVKYWSGDFHCVDCKIMGNNDTLKMYNCR